MMMNLSKEKSLFCTPCLFCYYLFDCNKSYTMSKPNKRIFFYKIWLFNERAFLELEIVALVLLFHILSSPWHNVNAMGMHICMQCCGAAKCAGL